MLRPRDDCLRVLQMQAINALYGVVLIGSCCSKKTKPINMQEFPMT